MSNSLFKIGNGRHLVSFPRALILLTFAFSFAVTSSGQEYTQDAAPPPLKIISKDDQARLDTKSDLKDRTKLSLDLMDIRLKEAERLAAAHDFDGMYRELGSFQAIMDDAVTFIRKRDDGRGKVFDNYKRIEIGLRKLAPRIEVMRRELPLKYDPYVRKLMGYLRSARAQATDSQFGDSVLPDKPDQF